MEASWSKPSLRTLADQVADTILERIVRGQLRPGETLPSQRDLARRLGVGMSVVREAIQRLQTLRVLTTRQGKGTVVEPVHWTQLMFEPALGVLALERRMLGQICEARNAIERETCRLAAERATAGDLAAIRQVLEAAGSAPGTYDENRALNKAFHLAVAVAAKNGVLVDLLAPLLELEFGVKRQIFDTSLSRRSWKVHRRIYDAIASRDQAAVAAAVADHAAALEDEMKKFETLNDEEPSAVPEIAATGGTVT